LKNNVSCSKVAEVLKGGRGSIARQGEGCTVLRRSIFYVNGQDKWCFSQVSARYPSLRLQVHSFIVPPAFIIMLIPINRRQI
jgi:hypothetical protein